MHSTMNALWRLAVLAVALVLSTCTAFVVSPTNKLALRPPSSSAAARHHQQVHHHVPAPVNANAGARRTTCRGPSMSVGGEPNNINESSSSGNAHTQQQRAAAVAVVTAVATLSGAAVPAHAEGFAQFFAEGIVGAINGPGILAIPIVLGFGLASAIAFFIYSFSQPREYDE